MPVGRFENKAALLAWVAVAATLVTLFGPALVGDHSFALRDAAHFYYPLFQSCCREWSAGRAPLWNPYENGGIPLLADATSSVFYPGKLVFLLPLDFALNYKLYIFIHVVLAGWGSYVLARTWKASPMAAAIAALAYACGGNVVFQYCNVVFLVGAAWLPLAALAIDRMMRLRSWPSAIGLGAILALMILGGDPQAAYHALLIAALYAGVLASVNEEQSLSVAATGSRVFRRLLWALGLISLAAVIAFLLAAVQVLPSAEATRYSERAAFNRPRNIYEAARVAFAPSDMKQPHDETRTQSILRGLFTPPEDGSHHDLAYDFSVGPWRLAEYVWPNVGGRMFPTNRRWISLLPGEGRTWTPTLYLGLLPIVLACWSLRLRSGDGRLRWLSWTVVLFTLASFGYYGVGWLLAEIYGSLLKQDASKLNIAPPVGGVYWLFVTLLPTYIYFRYPAKLLPLVSLGISQLAALGFDRALIERRPRLERALLILGGLSGAVAFVVWCIGPWLFGGVSRSDASLGPFDRQGAYYDVLFSFLQTACVALAARWLLIKAWAEPASVARCQTTAVLLTALEIVLANAWLFPTAPASLWRSESPVAAAIHSAERVDGDAARLPPRVFRGNLASWRPASFRQTMSATRPAELAQWEHDTLFPKYHTANNISLVESYGSIKLMDYESLLFVARQHGPQQADKSLLPQPTALRLVGTEFLVLPHQHQPEFADRIGHQADNWPEGAALWRMRRTLPRAWIVHEVEVFSPLPRPLRIETVDERTKEVLFPNNRARDFRRTAVIETDALPATSKRGARLDESSSAASGDNELCQIKYYDSQRVLIEADLAQPGLLILSDTWFPGWTAVVTAAGDAQFVPIYRTNRVLRGVWLAAGKQTIEFRFEPWSFYRGAIISCASWLVMCSVGIVLVIRKARPKPP